MILSLFLSFFLALSCLLFNKETQRGEVRYSKWPSLESNFLYHCYTVFGTWGAPLTSTEPTCLSNSAFRICIQRMWETQTIWQQWYSKWPHNKGRKCQIKSNKHTHIPTTLPFCRARTVHVCWDRGLTCEVHLCVLSPPTGHQRLFSMPPWWSWAAALPAGRPGRPAAGLEETGWGETGCSPLSCTSVVTIRNNNNTVCTNIELSQLTVLNCADNGMC